MTDTAYDRVAYPSAIFERTHPERMAVLATLHGLTPPDVRTARVLEIGCGDGMNMLAFAAAYPQAYFEGFDLAEQPIGRGTALAKEAGLTNVSLYVMNALDAPDRIAPGSFDYIIAHGVYAWVPEDVRAAVLKLMGSALSPNGVAFLSYNAMPGGYLRMVMRDMLLLEVGDIADPEEKLAATMHFLTGLKDMDPEGDPSVKMLNSLAESMLERSTALLFHDELGEVFAPQSLTQVANAAAVVGLRVLNDAGRNRHFDGFLDAAEVMPEDPEKAFLRTVQMADYISMRYFRQSILIRAEAPHSRLIDTDRLDGLLASTKMTHDRETNMFRNGNTVIEIDDDAFRLALQQIVESGVTRVPVSGLIDDSQRRAILLRLFNEWNVQLHTHPAPFATEVGSHPVSSPLLRAEIARGDMRVCTLDHRIIEIEQPGLRALLLAATGEKSLEEIMDSVAVEFDREKIGAAYAACAQRALMMG